MKSYKSTLRSGTVIPAMMVAAGLLAATGSAAIAKPGENLQGVQIAKNPCAAKNPCNPCGAKNPCNPCAAKNPCNPCGASGEAPELTKGEARAVYDCLMPALKSGYAKSGDRDAKSYASWNVYNTQPYVSGTHGGRYVNNYANAKAKAYGKFEKAGRMTSGAVLAKDSFSINSKGRAEAGPFFLMEKMRQGFLKASGDWKCTLVMPNGKIIGITNGCGSAM